MVEREDDSFEFVVTSLGGWPIIDSGWHDTDFDIAALIGRLRTMYGFTPLVLMYVSVDERNSAAHLIQVARIYPGCHFNAVQ